MTGLLIPLLKHAVIREQILADLVVRLGTLHNIVTNHEKYGDNMARAYVGDKLRFLIDALAGEVQINLAGEHAHKIGKPV